MGVSPVSHLGTGCPKLGNLLLALASERKHGTLVA